MNEPSMIVPQGPDARRAHGPAESLPDVYQGYGEASVAPVIDVSSIRGLLNRQRYLIIGTILAALVVGGIITILQKPLYTASATVQVAPNGNATMANLGLPVVVNPNQVDEYIQTLGKVVQSRSMAQTVAEDLQLGDRPEFLGEDIEDRRPENQTDEQWRETKTSIAAQKVQEGFSVITPRRDAIVTLNYTDESPALAAEIVNGYADAFATLDTRSDVEDNEYAKQFLENQIAETRDELRAAERAANLYARNAELVSAQAINLDTGTVATVTGNNLAAINSTVGEARAARIKAEQRWRAVENIPAAELPEVQNNATVQNLTQQRIQFQSQLASLREKYNEQFPEVADLRRKIEQIDAQITEVGRDVKASIRNDFIVAQRQEQALSAELDNVTNSALDEQDRQVQLEVLGRETQALKSKLDGLLGRYNILAGSANVDRGTITKLDSALVPTSPTSPNIFRNMLLALFAGIGLAGGFTFIREFFDDRIRSIDTVEDRLGLPVLGHTPRISSDALDNSANNQFSLLIESYASIKSTVEFSIPREKNVLQITSSQSSEGKSTTSMILAELFARFGRRTLLVDADMRRPSIGALIDEQTNEMGFGEVLLGHVEMKDVLIKSVHENLDILTMGNLPSNPVEVLSSREFDAFIEEQRRNYSMVIFDTPPVVGLADSPLISQRVDATIFVIESNSVRLWQAKAAIKRLQSTGANLIGAIITKYTPEKVGQNYGYGYDYYNYGKE